MAAIKTNIRSIRLSDELMEVIEAQGRDVHGEVRATDQPVRIRDAG